MDINEIRSWLTLLLLAVFIGIVVWAYSKKRKQDFHDAANLPLDEPEYPQEVSAKERGVK